MAIPTKRGLAYPLAIIDGGVATTTDIDLKRQEIISVLETRPYERVMQPLYGTPDYIFTAPPSAGVVANQVQIALEDQVQNVAFAVTAEASESGDYQLSVNWQINGQEQVPIQYVLRS